MKKLPIIRKFKVGSELEYIDYLVKGICKPGCFDHLPRRLQLEEGIFVQSIGYYVGPYFLTWSELENWFITPSNQGTYTKTQKEFYEEQNVEKIYENRSVIFTIEELKEFLKLDYGSCEIAIHDAYDELRELKRLGKNDEYRKKFYELRQLQNLEARRIEKAIEGSSKLP